MLVEILKFWVMGEMGKVFLFVFKCFLAFLKYYGFFFLVRGKRIYVVWGIGYKDYGI